MLPALPVGLRRRAPLAGLTATEVLLVVPHLLWPVDVLFVGGLGVLVVQLQACARYAPRPWHLRALLWPVPVLATLALTVPGFLTANELLLDVVLLAAGWGLGAMLRLSNERHLALQRELAAVRETQELRAAAHAAQERVAIAREMHDVLGQRVSVMVIQAGSARLRFAASLQDQDRDQDGLTALRDIETVGRQALTELRRVVQLLRSAEVLPAPPGLARLAELTNQLETAGLHVDLSVQGVPDVLAPGIDLSAYRILQECLTNALKHASTASARVRLRYEDDRLEIDVVNGAPLAAAPPPRPGGHGILGMRERAAAFGGEVSAQQVGGEFRVHAVLPLAVVA